jgi:pyridoxine 4-dehydrogenase
MDDQLQAVFNLCVSNGVTLFDTGDSYGTGSVCESNDVSCGSIFPLQRSPDWAFFTFL